MTLFAALAVFGIGVSAGLLSGLVGIGGGVLIVPFLYFFYSDPSFSGVLLSADAAVVAAHATSLFVIVPTAIRGVVVYQRARLVVWKAVVPIGIASVAAAVVGSRLATNAPAGLLKAIFAVLLVYTAVTLLLGQPALNSGVPPAPRPLRLNLPATLSTGVAVGTFSGVMGVGGGIVAIPLLMRVIGVELRRVAATSIGIILITSVAGTLSYMIGGPNTPLRRTWSIGYVDLTVGAVMATGALLSVRWGTVINQRLDPRALSQLFAALFALLGVWLLVESVGG